MPIHPTRQTSPSLFQSSIRLSTSTLYETVTLKQAFPRVFNKAIWHEICRLSPREFLSQQENVLNLLLNDEDKFLSQFRLFYNNHLVIYEWHVLASEKHLEIKDYVFTKLLKKTWADYKAILRENMTKLAKSSMKKQPPKHSPTYFLRSSNHTPKTSTIPQLKKPQSLPNSIHHSPSPKISESQFSQDYHQLFIKTLDACDGFKYIHYDFCRHQKGYENRNMYNRFIRMKKRNNSCERLNTFYEELRASEVEGKENSKKSCHRNNIFSKTFSFLKPTQVHNGSKYAKFELIPFDINEPSIPNTSDGQNRKSHFKSKGPKIHVMKKMPHQFGKQKKSTAFLIKTQKSPVLIQPMRV